MPPYANHLSNSSDLVTSHEATRSGFLELALERNRKSIPAIGEAHALKAAVKQVTSPEGLFEVPDIQKALLSAAGISEKAAKYFTEQDKHDAIQRLITEFLEPAGEDYIEELLYRFLLTKGDALGGMMRNIGGELGQRKFTQALLSTLRLQEIRFTWRQRRNAPWSDEDPGPLIDGRIQAIAWEHQQRKRVLLYNIKVPVVGQNVDICVLKCRPRDAERAIQTPASYIALGELKGGIDPAGADEHWKTARSALQRIRTQFNAQDVTPLPHTFFVGGAIVAGMANEIWEMLIRGSLENAANLASPNQLALLCRWLISI